MFKDNEANRRLLKFIAPLIILMGLVSITGEVLEIKSAQAGPNKDTQEVTLYKVTCWTPGVPTTDTNYVYKTETAGSVTPMVNGAVSIQIVKPGNKGTHVLVIGGFCVAESGNTITINKGGMLNFGGK